MVVSGESTLWGAPIELLDIALARARDRSYYVDQKIALSEARRKEFEEKTNS